MGFLKKALGGIGGFLLGGPAGAVAGMSLGSALSGSSAAKKAGAAQQAGIDQATQLQREMFEYQKGIMQPYMQTGASALQGLQQTAQQPVENFAFDYNAYFNSPEYAALRGQGEDMIMRNANMTGARTGASQAAMAGLAPQLAQMGRQNAMQQYQLNQAALTDQYNRQVGVAGLGLGSAQQVGSYAGNFGQNAGNLAVAGGQNRANTIQARNQALTGGFKDIASLLMGGF